MDTKRDVLQFQVILTDISPPVWRRIEVPAKYTFWDLHVAVQDAMGWLDYHLHMFRIPDPAFGEIAEIGIPDEDGFEDDPVCLASWTIPVARHFRAVGARATYEYDFGDGWIHHIELEAISRRQSGTKYPRCIDGERACPPEDCGGPGGYAELLETIADPTNDEYASTMEWLGGRFDPEAFTPSKVCFENPTKRWRIAFTERSDPGGAAG
jgi:Plasmid pRiA4b ORF-3-like protein